MEDIMKAALDSLLAVAVLIPRILQPVSWKLKTNPFLRHDILKKIKNCFSDLDIFKTGRDGGP